MNIKKVLSGDKSTKRDFSNGAAVVCNSPEGNGEKKKNKSVSGVTKKSSVTTKPQQNLNNRNDDVIEDTDKSGLVTSTQSNESRYYDDLDDFYQSDDPARPSGTLELKINNISKYKDMDFRTESKILNRETTIIRCLPWKILFMLRNQNPDRAQRCMGYFLQCNGSSDSSAWNCHAKAELRLVSQRKGPNMHDLVKNIEHNFFYRENDWGYSNFITWNDLTNAEKGYLDTDDSILLVVKVFADAPHGVNWDSKTHTGFVGLKNQGATCYMNSLLQALYFTNKLRRAVYQLPTETDDEQRSVSLALQRVFFELQFGEKSVGTKRLTKSFGWETLDTFMQHDAQELCRVLLDNLESKMKGTRVEDTIPTLFRGKMVSFIRCKKVDVESKREEAFYDIQLKVKGNSDVYKAFDEYISVESLDGENKYDAGEFGLQEAEKGIMFLKFPPVLYLQLMRFQYDYEADGNIKINDRFEFPYHLDLNKYLQDAYQNRKKYILHTVLVHSGDNHGGHYVAYLNPYGKNEWYKFDDDVVSRCSRREAILQNFGGNDEDASIKQSTSAYMLVYMCEDDIEDLLCPIENNVIPLNLHQRFANEKFVEDLKKKEKANAHLYSSVIILLDEDFYGWQGFELFDVDKCSFWRRLRFPRKSNVSELTKAIADSLHENTERIRLWSIVSKNNQIQLSLMEIRDTLPSSDNPVMIWIQSLPADDPAKSLPPIDSRQTLVFCKYYNPINNSMHFMNWILLRTGAPIKDIFPALRKRARLSDNVQLSLWEERERRILTAITNVNELFSAPYNGMIIIYEPNISNRTTLRKISTGDFFNCQDIRNSSCNSPIYNAYEFLHDLCQKVEVEFVEKVGELTACDLNNKPSPVRVVLWLSQKARYMEILKALVVNIPGTELVKVQLYKPCLPTHTSKTDLIPGDPIRTTFEGTLGDLISTQIQSQVNATLPRGKPNQIVPLINPSHQSALTSSMNNNPFSHTAHNYKRLYFQILKIPIHEVETMQQFCCIVANTRIQEQIEVVVTLPRTSYATDILIEAKKQAKISNISEIGYRLFEVIDHRIVNQIPLKMKLTELQPNSNRTIFIEAIASEEDKITNKNEILISVAHCQLETRTLFGIPFSIKIIDRESIADLRNRIRHRLDPSLVKEFDKWSLAVCTCTLESNYNRHTFTYKYLNNDNNAVIRTNIFESSSSFYNVYDSPDQSGLEPLITSDQPWLCIDHKMPATKRNRANLSEKPIKIHN